MKTQLVTDFLTQAKPTLVDPDAERRDINGRVFAIRARGPGAVVETPLGKAIVDRVDRDGLLFLWRGLVRAPVYWSRTIERDNWDRIGAWQRDHEGKPGAPPAPAERDPMVPDDEVKARTAAGEDIVLVPSDGSRIVEQVPITDVVLTADELANGIAAFDAWEAGRLE